MSVYKITEITGTSPESIEAAVGTAIRTRRQDIATFALV